MNVSSSILISKFDRTGNFSRLIERIQQCIHEREGNKDLQRRPIKIYSTIHYTDYLKRSIDESPLIGQVLFRLDHLIKNFSRQTNRNILRYSSLLMIQF